MSSSTASSDDKEVAMRKVIGGLAGLLMIVGFAPAASAADTTVVIPIPGTDCEYVIETFVSTRYPITDWYVEGYVRCDG